MASPKSQYDFEDAGAEAIVKLRVHGETRISAAEGNGPVNALDLALRKDSGPINAT